MFECTSVSCGETRGLDVQLTPEGGTSVMVVGDTHGQLHDVLNM